MHSNIAEQHAERKRRNRVVTARVQSRMQSGNAEYVASNAKAARATETAQELQRKTKASRHVQMGHLHWEEPQRKNSKSRPSSNTASLSYHVKPLLARYARSQGA